jgi:uncharacterized protein (DUF58 family)
LCNTGPKPSSGWRIVDRGPEHECDWFLERIACGESVRVNAQAVFLKRGLYSPDPLMGKCLHPFGLAQRVKKLADAHPWYVLPAIGKLDVEAFRQWISRTARSEGQVIRTSRPSMVRQDDLHGLRPFRPGDSPRWIHWRTSARRNQKMVREFEESGGQNLILIVDPWGSAEHLPALDQTVSLAATICWEWARHGHDQLFFAIASRQPVVITGSCTREKSLRMLQALADVEGELATDVKPVLQAVSRRVVPSAPAVVLSARLNSPLVAQLALVWSRRVIGLYVGDTHSFYDHPVLQRETSAGLLAPLEVPADDVAHVSVLPGVGR